MRQSWETMTSVSAGHIIQTPTQPVGSGRPQRESNPGPPHQESRALPQSYRAPPPPYRRATAPPSGMAVFTLYKPPIVYLTVTLHIQPADSYVFGLFVSLSCLKSFRYVWPASSLFLSRPVCYYIHHQNNLGFTGSIMLICFFFSVWRLSIAKFHVIHTLGLKWISPFLVGH